ncbi:DUF2292 domain-containing protein [Sporohalobacter salinus]|nr:DUF2292 domain-containing protein [Sporohalobacter salinus]MBM7624767.1 hypothetical protein [Sporohalobacter salinus]
MAEITQKLLEEIINEADDIDYGKVELIIKDGEIIDIVKQKRKRVGQ